MRYLITGAGGFAGSHLADHLAVLPEADVWGCDLTDRRRPEHPAALRLVACDLRDPQAARALMASVRPERVFHLAGQAAVSESWADPWATFEANLRAQLNLLEALRLEAPAARFLVLGSGEEYGRITPEDLPIRESCPLRPDSPYSVSKVGQDLLGLQYHLSHGLHIVRVRPFNHIGPRQNTKFVAPAFAAQIARIEAGQQAPVLQVGNLHTRRDFTDVRDIVRAYSLALELGEPGEVYNLGSGQMHSVQELLDRLLAASHARVRVEVDTDRLRPSDALEVCCDARRFHERTGWAPRIPFEQSLRDLLDYERARLRAGG